MPDTNTEPQPTMYHASVEDFRRQLVQSSATWEATMRPHWDAVMHARQTGESADSVPESVRDAAAAAMMASSYSYTLAAVIKMAEQEFGAEVAHALANTADDILTNGDDSCWNADVMPEASDG